MAMRKVQVLGHSRILITAPHSDRVGLVFDSWLAVARWGDALVLAARERAARDKEPEVETRWKVRWHQFVQEAEGKLSQDEVQILLDFERDRLWQKFASLDEGDEGPTRKAWSGIVKENLQKLAAEHGFRYERGRLQSL